MRDVYKRQVVAKPDGAPIAASWVSSQFGKLLEDLDMPHIRFHDLRHTAATNMHHLTGDFYTVGEVLGHTLAGIGASLGLSMNFEAVTARYVDAVSYTHLLCKTNFHKNHDILICQNLLMQAIS